MMRNVATHIGIGSDGKTWSVMVLVTELAAKEEADKIGELIESTLQNRLQKLQDKDAGTPRSLV